MASAPFAKRIAVIDNFMAFFADTIAKYIDHFPVHELDGIILLDDINTIIHGIENGIQHEFLFIHNAPFRDGIDRVL